MMEVNGNSQEVRRRFRPESQKIDGADSAELDILSEKGHRMKVSGDILISSTLM